MAVTTTTRFGLTQWSAGTDPYRRTHVQTSFAQLETLGLGYEAGPSLPAPGPEYKGFIFLDTDDDQIFYGDGTQWWQLVGGAGGFGSPAALSVGGSSSTGVASSASRADHEHPMPGVASTTDIGTAIAGGAATSVSRATHIHRLGTGSVSTASLSDNIIDNTSLADLAVTNSKLAVGSVVNAKIAANAVTETKFTDGAVTELKFAAGAVTGNKFGNFDASKVGSGVFHPDRIPSLDASKVTSGVFGATQFPEGTYIPPGAIVPYSATSGVLDTSAWLLCNGQSITSSSHPALHAVLSAAGYPYGGSGTSANVPDLRQTFPLGQAASGTGSVLGQKAGSIDHNHTGPSHTHAFDPPSTSTSSDNSHTHTTPNTNSGGSHLHDLPNNTGNATGTSTHTGNGLNTANNVTNNHTWSDSSQGGGSHVHELQGGGSSSSAGSHSHSFSGTTATYTCNFAHLHTHAMGNSDSVGSHTHTIGTSGSGGSHSHSYDISSFTSDASGTGSTGSTNPPFLALNFVIKI